MYRNGFEYRNYDLQVIKYDIFATFCAILVKSGLLTPEITPGASVTFGTRRQYSTYFTKYLSKFATKLHQLFSLGRRLYAERRVKTVNFDVCNKAPKLIGYHSNVRLFNYHKTYFSKFFVVVKETYVAMVTD